MTFARCIYAASAAALLAAAVIAAHGIYQVTQTRAGLAAIESRLAMLRVIEQAGGEVQAQWTFLDEAVRQKAAVDESRIIEWSAQIESRLARAADGLAGDDARRAAPLLARYSDFAAYASDLLLAHTAGDGETVNILLPDLEKTFAEIQARTQALRRGAADAMAGASTRAKAAEIWQWALSAGLLTAAGVFSFGLAFFAARGARRGVDALLNGAKRIAGGDFTQPVGDAGPGEISQLAKALDIMAGQLRVRTGVRETFGPHLDPGAVAGVIEIPRMDKTGGERRPMTVLAAALEDANGIAEHLPPAAAVRAFNAWFDFTSGLLARHGGVVERRMDGGIMAYWGAPFSNADDAPAKACRAALELVSGLDRLTGEIAAETGGLPAEINLDVHAGIAAGEAVAGMFGSRAARGFTVLGGPVRLARRLEMLNAAHGARVVIDDAVRFKTGGVFETRELDRIDQHGAEPPMRAHELLGVKEA